MNEEKKEILEEGKIAGTSPADDEEEEEGIELNNASEPTLEEAENANVVDEVSENDTESEIVEQPQAEAEIDPTLGTAEAEAITPTFTQSQVDEIAGKVRKETREKVTKDFFARYGVNSAEELDNLFGDAQRYDITKEQYDSDKKSWQEADAAREKQISELQESVALLSSGIDSNRYEDAKFILKGKGLQVTVENIQNELATHPEWKAEVSTPAAGSGESPFRKIVPTPEAIANPNPKPATTIDVLGNDASSANTNNELSDYEKAMKLYRV